MPPASNDQAPALSVNEVRLSDGRVARLLDYDEARERRVGRLMLAAKLPHTIVLAPVQGALLALLSIGTLDGEVMQWPEPRNQAIDDFIRGFVPRDVDMLVRRYAASRPRGERYAPFWKSLPSMPRGAR